MSDSQSRRDIVPEETAPRNTDATLSRQGVRPVDDQGATPTSSAGLAQESEREGDVRPNLHDDRHAPKTAMQTGGIAIGMFFPVVIIVIVAIVVIAYFLLT